MTVVRGRREEGPVSNRGIVLQTERVDGRPFWLKVGNIVPMKPATKQAIQSPAKKMRDFISWRNMVLIIK